MWGQVILHDTGYILPSILLTIMICSGSAAVKEVYTILNAVLVDMEIILAE